MKRKSKKRITRVQISPHTPLPLKRKKVRKITLMGRQILDSEGNELSLEQAKELVRLGMVEVNHVDLRKALGICSEN